MSLTKYSAAAVGLTLVAAALSGCSDDAGNPAAPTLQPDAAPRALAAATDPVVPGQYLVTFRTDTALAPMSQTGPTSQIASARNAAVARVTALVAADGGHVTRTYHTLVDGMSVQLSDSALATLRRDPAVLRVEPDPIISAAGTQTGVGWALDRLDQSSLPFDATYTYANDGSGVYVYLVDTGITTSNPDFGGRALAGHDAVTPGGDSQDCNGHGTEVASIIGSTTFGVVKGVTLYAVRALDCTGYAYGSWLLDGLNWVASQKQQFPARRMVVNVSMSGVGTATLDSAIVRLVRLGVTVIAPAGNAAGDACKYWPGSVPAAITVGGTDRRDTLYPSSNLGRCLDLLAPAVGVPADLGTSRVTAMTGTSASAPITTGAAAMYLAAHPTATPAQIATALINGATVGAIQNVPSGTPNRLVSVAFMGSGTGTTPPPPPPPVTYTNPTSTKAYSSALAATCVTAPQTGTAVTLTPCVVGDPGQMWRMAYVGVPDLVSVFGNMCLAATGTGGVGSTVVVAACDRSAPMQLWTRTATKQSKLATGYCLDIASATQATPTLQVCNGSAGQVWDR